MELLLGDIKAFAELFDGMESGKVFAQDKEDEEQAVAGIGAMISERTAWACSQLSQNTRMMQRSSFCFLPALKSMIDLP